MWLEDQHRVFRDTHAAPSQMDPADRRNSKCPKTAWRASELLNAPIQSGIQELRAAMYVLQYFTAKKTGFQLFKIDIPISCELSKLIKVAKNAMFAVLNQPSFPFQIIRNQKTHTLRIFDVLGILYAYNTF